MPSRTTQPIVISGMDEGRLYDAVHGRYLSIEQLHGWATAGVLFTVADSETGAI